MPGLSPPAPDSDRVLAAYSCSTFCSSATMPSRLSSLAFRIHAKAFDRSACIRGLACLMSLPRQSINSSLVCLSQT